MKLVASGHLSDEDDVVAEAFESADVVTAGTFCIAASKMIGSEVVMRHAVLEDVPEGDHHGVLDSDDGFLRPATRFEAMVERAVVAFLRADGVARQCPPTCPRAPPNARQ